MNHKTILEIVSKLIGQMSPIGEFRFDEKCLENLYQYGLFLNEAVDNIIPLIGNMKSKERSVQDIGMEANSILYNIYMQLKDMYEPEEE